MNLRSPAGLLIAMLSVLAAACGGERGSLGNGGPEWLSSKAEPVQLAITLDAERTRGKVITPEGGTVTATGADGTRYSLRFPRGALLSDEVITITPVSHLEGLPLQGDSFATVQLEPSGLQLQEPAILTIRTRWDVPLEEQVAFGYFGAGHDAHLAPILPDERGRVEIPVLHFSGYGYGRAAPNDPGRVALQQAVSYQARLSSRVAKALESERQRQLSGEGGGDLSAVHTALVEYYDAVLRPLLQTAMSDDRMAACALQRYLAWEREAQLLGFGGADEGKKPANRPQRPDAVDAVAQRVAEGRQTSHRLFTLTVERRIERWLERCRKEHDLGIAREVLGLERLGALLGARSDQQFEKTWDALFRCASFEVEFRSVIEFKTPTGVMYHHVAAKVPYTFASAEPQTAPLEYVAFRASGNPLQDLGGVSSSNSILGMIMSDAEATLSAAGTKEGTARVFAIAFDLNQKEEPGTNCDGQDDKRIVDVAEGFRVILGPGVPTEVLRITPVRQGEQPQLMAAVEEGLRRAGSTRSIDGGRIGGPITSEETYWAEEWAKLHAEQRLAVFDSLPVDHPGGAYKLPVRPVTKGVWRADFDTSSTETGTLAGFSRSEKGYVVVRHTPK